MPAAGPPRPQARLIGCVVVSPGLGPEAGPDPPPADPALEVGPRLFPGVPNRRRKVREQARPADCPAPVGRRAAGGAPGKAEAQWADPLPRRGDSLTINYNTYDSKHREPGLPGQAPRHRGGRGVQRVHHRTQEQAQGGAN